jgi:ADP-ribosylglycohydrolase
MHEDRAAGCLLAAAVEDAVGTAEALTARAAEGVRAPP